MIVFSIAFVGAGCGTQKTANTGTVGNTNYSPFAAVVLKNNTQLYTNTSYNFSFEFPKTWEYELAKSNKDVQLLLLNNAGATVTVKVISQEKDPDRFREIQSQFSSTTNVLRLSEDDATVIKISETAYIQFVVAIKIGAGADRDALQGDVDSMINSFTTPAKPVR